MSDIKTYIRGRVLSDRDAHILQLHSEEETYKDIGLKVGLSAYRVSLIVHLINRYSKRPLWDNMLGRRTRNCLKKAGIETLDDLMATSAKDLLKLQNFGQVCLKEVKSYLAEIGRDDWDEEPGKQESPLLGANWVPVEHNLPDPNTDVVIKLKDGTVMSAYWCTNEKRDISWKPSSDLIYYVNASMYLKKEDVVAWRLDIP